MFPVVHLKEVFHSFHCGVLIIFLELPFGRLLFARLLPASKKLHFYSARYFNILLCSIAQSIPEIRMYLQSCNRSSLLIILKSHQQLKRWERKECKPNSLPVLHKMHVKLGDTVKVISGKDKGKIGEVSRIITHNSSIVIKDINLKTKHVKSKGEDEPGQIIKIEAPIHSSNVMLYSKDQDVVSRVGHKTLDNGKRVRYLIKTGEVIDSAENWKRVAKEKEKATEVAAAS